MEPGGDKNRMEAEILIRVVKVLKSIWNFIGEQFILGRVAIFSFGSDIRDLQQ